MKKFIQKHITSSLITVAIGCLLTGATFMYGFVNRTSHTNQEFNKHLEDFRGVKSELRIHDTQIQIIKHQTKRIKRIEDKIDKIYQHLSEN